MLFNQSSRLIAWSQSKMPPQQGDSLLGFIDHVFDFRSHFPVSLSQSSSGAGEIAHFRFSPSHGDALSFWFRAIPGKVALRFSRQNRYALLLELL
ncbi:hypothetical protein [Rhizobium leguminosarum]|uniref:hypothetical protein n=1 Tax=Rhizobium leguminosarum TaxID=384 RepID=UPI00164A02AF|nr:hypothetical protein [Rhizobium leguminosarum]